MKRLILFSQPTEQNNKELLTKLLPKELKGRIFAYMPSNGRASNQEYTDYWKKVASDEGFEFLFIDNMQEGETAKKEIEKLNKATVLLITGGNTFELLRNLRRSRLDKGIKNFQNKGDYVIAGFSAGAIVLTPQIDVAGQPKGIDTTQVKDENKVGITDLEGLNLVDFEVFPHYNEDRDRLILENYKKMSSHKVRAFKNDDLLIIDK